jgi:hypothetical protein
MKCAVGTFARAICSSSAEVSTPVTSYLTSTSALVRAPHRSLHPLFSGYMRRNSTGGAQSRLLLRGRRFQMPWREHTPHRTGTGIAPGCLAPRPYDSMQSFLNGFGPVEKGGPLLGRIPAERARPRSPVASAPVSYLSTRLIRTMMIRECSQFFEPRRCRENLPSVRIHFRNSALQFTTTVTLG